MHLELGGHPIHTRALSVTLARRPQGGLTASAELVDLRKRGFTPVGSELQGAGIIHQMGLDALVEGRVLRRVAVRQPVVAFEASAATGGESCRDVAAGVAELAGLEVETAAGRLRPSMGGAAGCSHLLVLAQFLLATLAGRDDDAASDAVHGRVLRRDLIIDGSERADGRLGIALQLGDLVSRPAPADEPPAARLTAHAEWRVVLVLDGWPATIAAIEGATRRRTPHTFADAAWENLDQVLTPLTGASLGRGGAQALAQALGGHPPLRDALLQLAPALIQCRASFPDKWLNAAMRPGHDGLIGMADSCYMWRRGGALEQMRVSRSK
ncbi:MAG: DUF2889 domain-containing protein [Deltaproteobacteria bacterium]|nr:DUF2889 domain-containing protein [Deltaproteobacteria bacterium]